MRRQEGEREVEGEEERVGRKQSGRGMARKVLESRSDQVEMVGEGQTGRLEMVTEREEMRGEG